MGEGYICDKCGVAYETKHVDRRYVGGKFETGTAWYYTICIDCNRKLREWIEG